MIKIKTKELRRFISLASHIKDTKLLPMYGYVKIVVKDGACTIYKSNAFSYIIAPVEAECGADEVILVEEVVLFGYVGATSRDEISISAEGVNGILNDGKKPWKFRAIEDHYPAIQQKEEGGEVFELTSDVLSALHVCKFHTRKPEDKAIRSWETFVHVSKAGDKYGIAGYNGITAHFQLFKNKLHEMVFDTDTISIIAKYDSVQYSSAGNYDLFDCGGATYGFIKPEIGARPLTKFLENLAKGEKACVVNRKSILEFCETVIKTSNSNLVPEIKISGESKESKIILTHDSVTENHGEEVVWVEEKEKAFEPYIFNPNYIILLLKDLDYDEIEISTIKEGFVIKSKEEPNFMGLVARMN